MKHVLSGIQPSGKFHLGNYLGATKQHMEMQEKFSCMYMLADLHALTTVRDAELLRKSTFDLAANYLALGLDPEKTVLFKQSDVPEHTELTWIFDCITPMGLLERAHAWKDAEAKGIKEPTAGLFNYPVLMSADILLYKPDLVPVGKDQKQHIEIARDIAVKFNEHFGETFPMPEDYIKPEVAVVPGTDGQKMSKSYKNTIDIFEEESVIKKQVMGIVTDSKGVEEAKDPATCVPFLLYQHIATAAEKQEMEERLKKGGLGYGELKKALLEKVLEYFADAREKKKQFEKNPDFVHDVLAEGGKRAREVAGETMEEVRKKVGLR